jgi:hypothetical protein
MNVTALTLLILQINKLIDSGKCNDISIDDVHNAIKNKSLLRFLKEKAGSGIDLSGHIDCKTFGEFEEYYEEKMNNIYEAYAGDERRKWGVKNLGLCLTLAWTNEIIQKGDRLGWL